MRVFDGEMGPKLGFSGCRPPMRCTLAFAATAPRCLGTLRRPVSPRLGPRTSRRNARVALRAVKQAAPFAAHVQRNLLLEEEEEEGEEEAQLQEEPTENGAELRETMNNATQEDTEGLERLRKISVAGSHQLRRFAADMRTTMEPVRSAFDFMVLRSHSTQLMLDVVLVFGLFLLLRYGVSRALYILYHKLDPSRGKVSYKESVFECMQRPLEFLSVFTVGTSIAEVVAQPLSATGAAKYIRVSRELGVIFAATWFILRWIERLRSRFSSDGRTDKTQVDSISRLATVFTVVIAVLVMMDTIGLRLSSVLAFGGIGGVAIGFAGREIISNFFAGFMLFLTRPFSVGDWIRSIENKDVEGTVEDMGWYMTMIRTWEKRPIYVPNSRFSTFIIENPSRMTNRRIKHEIHIRLEDFPVARTIVGEIEGILKEHQDLDPKQHRLCFIDRFDPHSVVVWFSCYTRTVFLSEYRTVQQALLLEVHDVITKHGARLASDLYRNVREGSATEAIMSRRQEERIEAAADVAAEQRDPSAGNGAPAVPGRDDSSGAEVEPRQEVRVAAENGNGRPHEAKEVPKKEDSKRQATMPKDGVTRAETTEAQNTQDRARNEEAAVAQAQSAQKRSEEKGNGTHVKRHSPEGANGQEHENSRPAEADHTETRGGDSGSRERKIVGTVRKDADHADDRTAPREMKIIGEVKKDHPREKQDGAKKEPPREKQDGHAKVAATSAADSKGSGTRPESPGGRAGAPTTAGEHAPSEGKTNPGEMVIVGEKKVQNSDQGERREPGEPKKDPTREKQEGHAKVATTPAADSKGSDARPASPGGRAGAPTTAGEHAPSDGKTNPGEMVIVGEKKSVQNSDQGERREPGEPKKDPTREKQEGYARGLATSASEGNGSGVRSASSNGRGNAPTTAADAPQSESTNPGEMVIVGEKKVQNGDHAERREPGEPKKDPTREKQEGHARGLATSASDGNGSGVRSASSNGRGNGPTTAADAPQSEVNTNIESSGDMVIVGERPSSEGPEKREADRRDDSKNANRPAPAPGDGTAAASTPEGAGDGPLAADQADKHSSDSAGKSKPPGEMLIFGEVQSRETRTQAPKSESRTSRDDKSATSKDKTSSQP